MEVQQVYHNLTQLVDYPFKSQENQRNLERVNHSLNKKLKYHQRQPTQYI